MESINGDYTRISTEPRSSPWVAMVSQNMEKARLSTGYSASRLVP